MSRSGVGPPDFSLACSRPDAALAVLGQNARFTTKVVRGARAGSIILVGGGDPTLAVNPFPAQDYPQPATLASLAKATARALRAQGHRTVGRARVRVRLSRHRAADMGRVQPLV